ncbi:MAG TPA: AtpZ/AtpI family protein [Firmicutes bacterium]|nr:AtpZ/AtpI family protein [Bacillota bacterium]
MWDLKFDPDIVRALKFYGTIGFNVAGSMILGFLFGRILDKRLGTEPLCSIFGFLLGAASGFWGVWKLTLSEFSGHSGGRPRDRQGRSDNCKQSGNCKAGPDRKGRKGRK